VSRDSSDAIGLNISHRNMVRDWDIDSNNQSRLHSNVQTKGAAPPAAAAGIRPSALAELAMKLSPSRKGYRDFKPHTSRSLDVCTC
jgi:hypothetical protein